MKNRPFWDQKKTKELFKAIIKLKTTQECSKFFRDLCTLEEMASIADRWQMVILLNKGMPQREVAKKLKVSIATVTRVNWWIKHGKGGYRLALERTKKK